MDTPSESRLALKLIIIVSALVDCNSVPLVGTFSLIAHKGEFPSVVNIRISNNGICGGTLIRPNAILTAAHCVYNRTTKRNSPPNEIFVHAGNPRLRYNPHREVVKQASAVYIHPNFIEKENYLENDIAIVRTKEDFAFISGVIEPITLPRQSVKLPSFTQGVIVGWGKTDSSSGESKVLRKLTIPIRPEALCVKRFSRYGFNPHRQFCAGGNGKDACDGDSGGPFLVNLKQGEAETENREDWILYGIVSYGIGAKCGDYPGVYVRVSEYISWIEEHSTNNSNAPKIEFDKKTFSFFTIMMVVILCTL